MAKVGISWFVCAAAVSLTPMPLLASEPCDYIPVHALTGVVDYTTREIYGGSYHWRMDLRLDRPTCTRQHPDRSSPYTEMSSLQRVISPDDDDLIKNLKIGQHVVVEGSLVESERGYGMEGWVMWEDLVATKVMLTP